MDNKHQIALHIVLSQIHERETRKRVAKQRVIKKSNAKRNGKLRSDLLDLLGRKCTKCGYDEDVRALQIDHIHGGGRQERLTFKSPMAYYRHILKDPDGYQMLCANCNQIKKYENKEWGGNWKKKVVIQDSDTDHI